MKETSSAFAKINISLDIVSKMADGYHDLVTVMQTVDLADEITVECLPGEGVIVDSGLPYLPCDDRNIAVKAVNAFFDFTGIKGYRVRIIIKKSIPVSAGLGGGSSDGACVLRMLNKIFETGLDNKTLEKLGITIGSDVPFNITGGTKLAKGRGDILTDLPDLPKCNIVICKPRFSCSTPELFERIKCEKIRARPATDGLLKALDEGDLGGVARRMYNVFEDVLPRGKQDVDEIKGILLDCGALGAVMTGSGPSVLGIYDDLSHATGAYERLNDIYNECFLTQPV